MASQKRRKASRGEKPSRFEVKSAICLVVFILAALGRIFFPSAFLTVSEKVKTVMADGIDYRRAVSALSDGITGKTSLKDAAVTVMNCITNGEAVRVTAEADGETDPFSDFAVPADATYDKSEISFPTIRPVAGEITSAFGYRIHPVSGDVRFHYGVDIACDEGTDVSSFADGEVLAVSDTTDYGNNILIRHADDTMTRYAHLSRITAKVGDTVTAGQKIGESGSTGNATGACLHFEIRVGEHFVNPAYYL